MKITDLAPQKNNPNRVNVYLDGQFAFGMSLALRYKHKLEIDSDIDQKTITTLVEQDQLSRITDRMLRFLSFRPRSEKEVYDHFLYKATLKDLAASDIEIATYKKSIEKALEKLKEWGQLNDAEFVTWWIEQRNRFKPRGERLLRLELQQKGVTRDLIDSFFQNTPDTKDSDAAMRALAKKLPQFQKLPLPEFKKKVRDFLLRRGFDWEVIASIIDTQGQKKVQ